MRVQVYEDMWISSHRISGLMLPDWWRIIDGRDVILFQRCKAGFEDVLILQWCQPFRRMPGRVAVICLVFAFSLWRGYAIMQMKGTKRLLTFMNQSHPTIVASNYEPWLVFSFSIETTDVTMAPWRSGDWAAGCLSWRWMCFFSASGAWWSTARIYHCKSHSECQESKLAKQKKT